MEVHKRRESLRGLAESILDRFSQSATKQQWADWLEIPMQYSAAAGDRDMTLKLFAAGASGNVMMTACRGGRDALVNDLLRAGVSPSERDDTTASVPLHVASSLGHVGIVRSLLQGAVKDEKEATGRASLHMAIEHGHLPVVRTLLAAGAAVNLRTSGDNMSALILACRTGHVAMVQLLIGHGADVGAYSGRCPETA